MTEQEIGTLQNFLEKTDHYLEFGTGGSTCIASRLVQKSINSIDSSTEWLEKVREETLKDQYKIKPELHFVDIGPTGHWGKPTDPGSRGKWPDYHSAIWPKIIRQEVDFVFVDGRFRVACCAQAALNTREDVLIAVHDYTRVRYHVVESFLRPILMVDGLCFFVVRPRWTLASAAAIAAKYAHVPD
jgi:hypothetical protein